MFLYFQMLATLCCALFAGASIYINCVEHPARVSCGAKVALAQWMPSYQRATFMQVSLAVLGFIFSAAARILGADLSVFVAGILLGAVVPYTLICVMSTNQQLSRLTANSDEREIMALLTRWNRLHAVRSLLSGIALVLLLMQTFHVHQ